MNTENLGIWIFRSICAIGIVIGGIFNPAIAVILGSCLLFSLLL